MAKNTESLNSVVLVEEGLGVLDSRLDGVRAGLPASGANLTVNIGVLEGLNQTKSLIDRSTNRQIVDGDLTEVLLIVNDEETTEGNAGRFEVDTIVLGDR